MRHGSGADRCGTGNPHFRESCLPQVVSRWVTGVALGTVLSISSMVVVTQTVDRHSKPFSMLGYVFEFDIRDAESSLAGNCDRMRRNCWSRASEGVAVANALLSSSRLGCP